MRFWIRVIIILLVAAVMVCPALDHTTAQTDCPGAPVPRLVPDMQARVIVQGDGLDGLLRVRADAGAASDVLVDMQNGDTFAVIDGPTCVDDYLWWQIVTTGGIAGWVAEGTVANYFVEPLAEPNPNPLPAAPDRLVARLGNGSASTAAWSPDGQMLAVAGSRGVWLYTPDLDPIAFMEGPALAEAAWSPDGSRVVGAGDDGTLPVWDVAARQIALQIPAYDDPAQRVSWSADGLRLASASGESLVQVWDAASGVLLDTLELPGPVMFVRWNPVANQLAASYAMEDEWGTSGFIVQVWDAEDFTPIYQLDRLLPLRYPHFRWSADGTQVAGFMGMDILTVTVSDGAQDFLTSDLNIGGSSDLGDFVWTPDGVFIWSAAYSGGNSFSSAVTRGVLSDVGYDIKYVGDCGRMPRSLAWRPGSNQLAVIDDCFLTLLDGDTLTLLKQREDFAYPNLVWDQAGQPTLTEEAPAGSRFDVTTVTEQGIFEIQDTTTDQAPVQINDGCFMNRDFVYRFSPDGQHVAVVCPYNGIFPVWETATGAQTINLPLLDMICTPEWGVQSCRIGWSATGRYLYLIGNDFNQQKQLLVWDFQTGENILTQPFNGSDLLWNADDRYVASLVARRLVIWDTAIWRAWESSVAIEPSPYRWLLTWNGDGTRLISAGSGAQHTVMIWEAPAAHIWRELSGHTAWITALGWSPDYTRVASGDADGTVRIWDSASGQLLLTLPGHQGPVWYFYWKPDGSQLAVVSEERTARVWDVR
jgi:WD40 repeat protein